MENTSEENVDLTPCKRQSKLSLLPYASLVAEHQSCSLMPPRHSRAFFRLLSQCCCISKKKSFFKSIYHISFELPVYLLIFFKNLISSKSKWCCVLMLGRGVGGVNTNTRLEHQQGQGRPRMTN